MAKTVKRSMKKETVKVAPVVEKVAEVKDTTIVIEVSNGVNIVVEKNFIQPSPEAMAANQRK